VTPPSWQCLACPDGTYSSGGTGTECQACPFGQTPNDDQSECVAGGCPDNMVSTPDGHCTVCMHGMTPNEDGTECGTDELVEDLLNQEAERQANIARCEDQLRRRQRWAGRNITFRWVTGEDVNEQTLYLPGLNEALGAMTIHKNCSQLFLPEVSDPEDA